MTILDFGYEVMKTLEEESVKHINFTFNIYITENKQYIPVEYTNKILPAKVSERRGHFNPVTTPSLRPIHIITKWEDEDFYPLKLYDAVLIVDDKTSNLFPLSKFKMREL